MSINPRSTHICSHCGRTGNGYITYENGFEFNCYCCSCVDKLLDSEIPPELMSQRYKYSVNVLKSCGAVAQGNFPKFIDRRDG